MKLFIVRYKQTATGGSWNYVVHPKKASALSQVRNLLGFNYRDVSLLTASVAAPEVFELKVSLKGGKQ